MFYCTNTGTSRVFIPALISQILRKAIKIGTRQVGHLEQWAQGTVQKGTNRKTGMTTRMKFDGISQAIHVLHVALCSDQCDFWHPPSQYLEIYHQSSTYDKSEQTSYLAFSQPLHFLSAALGLPHHEHLYNATVFGLTRGCEHLCG